MILLRRVGLGKVGGEDMGTLAKLDGERRQRGFARAGEGDGRALGVQRPRDGAADAAGSAPVTRAFWPVRSNI